MGSLSDYSELELLDHVFNAAYSPAADIYVGFSTADPTDVGSGLAEPSGNNYAREVIVFDAATSRKVLQNGAIEFNQASGAWGDLTHWALFDALTAGNMLAHGALSSTLSPVAGNTPTIPDEEIYVQIDATGAGAGLSNYLVHKLLDLMFNGTAYSKPDTYLALASVAVADDDDDYTEITEMTGTSYARKQVNINGGASPTWDLAASGVVDNTDTITFASPGADDWDEIVALVVMDAATNGNVLAYDNANIEDQTPGSGDTIQFAAGALDVTLS
jgi:hypothetical protein